jgi:hypothetical protein
MRIVQFGDEMKCFGCNELGHIKTRCPYAEHTCTKCNKKGHRDCNFASRLNANEASTLPQNEEDHEFDGQHVSSSQMNIIRDDLGNEEAASQINTINDIQISIQKEGNLMYEKTALKLGNSSNFKKRGALDLSSNSVTSSSEQENKKNRNNESVNSSDSSLQSDNNESMNQTREHDERMNEKERNNELSSQNNGGIDTNEKI